MPSGPGALSLQVFNVSYISSLLNCRHFVCLSSIYLCNIVIKMILWFCFNSIFIDILYKTVIFFLISVQFLVIPVSVSRVSFSIIASFLLSNFRKYLFNLSPSWNHFVFALLASASHFRSKIAFLYINSCSISSLLRSRLWRGTEPLLTISDISFIHILSSSSFSLLYLFLTHSPNMVLREVLRTFNLILAD